VHCLRIFVFSAGATVLVSASAAHAQSNRAPVAKDLEATSLYRASAEWIVKTGLTLTADDPDPNPAGTGEWTFRILNPERLRLGNASRLTCEGQPTGGNVPIQVTTPNLHISCEYQPPIDTEGHEQFQFDVTDAAGSTSAPATVTINIRPQGLRWQLVTGAGQSFSSDLAGGAGSIPDVLGAIKQDFMFNLDWVFRNPQKDATERRLGATADGHALARVGYTNRAEAVTATPVALTSGGTVVPGTGAQEDAVAPRRKATFGGEVNYNFVLSATNSGSFLEFGGFGRGSLDVDVEKDETLEETADRVLRLARKNGGTGSFRSEVGGRVVLKHPHKEMFRTITQHGEDGKQTYTRNADDLVSVEFGYQHDESLKGLEATTGVKSQRYFVRALMTLVEIPGAPGHSKPLFGVELTGGPNQPRQVTLLYGADISAIGTLFGVGK
jgi:hypothetical protein